MAVEQKRACGYRKVGGLYLCGDGPSMACDRLPYRLKVCPICGSGVKFSRGWTWIDWSMYAGDHKVCREPVLPGCVVCTPSIYTSLNVDNRHPYGLLWVGEQTYSPELFIQEALVMGVSRRIAAVPRNLELGETIVLFAHMKAIAVAALASGSTDLRLENFRYSEFVPGIFYAFRPQSIELLIWASEATPEYHDHLVKRGITPIIIPDGDMDHHPNTKDQVSSIDRDTLVVINKLELAKKTLAGR